MTPNASHNKIEGIVLRDNDLAVLRVRVTAVPDKGKANKALIALLAKQFSIPKSSISVTSGHTSRQKTLSITGGTKHLFELMEKFLSQMQTI